MGDAASDPALAELVAKQAITEVVYRYCRGIDRVDRELVRNCYWPEATDEHGSFVGLRDDYISWVFDKLLPRYTMSYHFIGNVLIDVDLAAGRAKSEAYGWSRHEMPSDNPAHNLTSGFRYVDDFERRPSLAEAVAPSSAEWRIRRRICTLEWVRRDDPATWWAAPESHRRGQRDGTDVVYLQYLAEPDLT
jgi:hypothetical protein